MDSTGKSWFNVFLKTFGNAIKSASGKLAVAGGITQIDSPLPGPADVVGGILASVITATCLGEAFAVTFSGKSLDEENARENEKVISGLESKRLKARFPENPYNFHPKGLTRVVRVSIGSGKNGGIIHWCIPNTKITIFEWNEDYRFGAHYHTLKPEYKNAHLNGIHYRAGDIIPEPWNTIYF